MFCVFLRSTGHLGLSMELFLFSPPNLWSHAVPRVPGVAAAAGFGAPELGDLDVPDSRSFHVILHR